MEVTVCINHSDKRALSKNLSDSHTVNAKVTDACDILNPTLELEYWSALSDKNYLRIPSWNRDYFIDSMTVLEGGRCIIKAKVDVLSTYKTQILNLSAVVTRQQSKGNYYLNDPVYKARQYKIVTVQEFPNNIFTEDGSLVLAVSGSETEL